jgi:hypothetical protein
MLSHACKGVLDLHHIRFPVQEPREQGNPLWDAEEQSEVNIDHSLFC